MDYQHSGVNFMKTNMTLLVKLGGDEFEIEHKTGMGNLTRLWSIGNGYRINRGLQPLDLDNWLRRPQTEEFVRVIEHNLNVSEKDDTVDAQENLFEKQSVSSPVETTYQQCYSKQRRITSPLLKTKRGRYAGTWAHLYILIDAATYLDAQFKFEVYETFITNQLLEWRDKSGDEFIALNVVLDEWLMSRGIVDDNKRQELFINVAKQVKKRINPEGGEWNQATSEQLHLRIAIQEYLIQIVRDGLLKDEEQLMKIISNFKQR